MKPKAPYSEILLGAVLLLVLGAVAWLVAPHSTISITAAIAPTNRVTDAPIGSPTAPVTDVPTNPPTMVPTSYPVDSQAIPPDMHAAATAYATDCGKDWYKATDQAVIRRCSNLKMDALGVEAEQQQTAIAQMPTFTPNPTWIWDGTPLPTNPADAAKMEIGRDDLGDRPGSRPFFLRAAIDMWHIGAVSEVIQSGNIEVYAVSLVSYRGGSFVTHVFFEPISDQLQAQVSHTWNCSQPIGDLMITNVTGIDGIVTFKSSTGTTGTLNMATGAWQFTSPIITATPTPVTPVAATAVPAIAP